VGRHLRFFQAYVPVEHMSKKRQLEAYKKESRAGANSQTLAHKGNRRDAINRTDIDCRTVQAPVHLDSNIRNVLEVRQEIVPLIFIPGIMGSRLRDKDGKKVWDPDSKIFMLCKFGLFWQNAKSRKEKLVGNAYNSEFLSVIEDDSRHNKKFKNVIDPTRIKRGWGGVGWSSYGKFLIALQTRQWEPPIDLAFNMPVYAFGYNWTACNGLAAEKLANYINRLLDSYTSKGRLCERVILITHSMGGLVARAACKQPGIADKILGVIHGVQPAMGSAAAYWRMKGGFERPHTIPELDKWQWLHNPSKTLYHKMETLLTKGYSFEIGTDIGLGNVTAWVLGSDGEEVTSLLGNMPGGLELLPNKWYRDNDGNKEWLVFVNPDGKKTQLPRSDPYEEIYRRKQEFYRLVNPKWLNPGRAKGQEEFERTDWNLYVKYLAQAETFHNGLGKKKVHHDTYQFYSTGIASADRVVFVRTLDTLAAKGKRLLEMVKNEWFDKAESTALDKTKEQLLRPLTKTAKQRLFLGLTWKDVVFHPEKVIDTAKRLPKTLGEVADLLKAGVSSFSGTMPMVRGVAGAVGKGLAVAAAKTTIGLLVRDTEWYINRGGYRDRVDNNLGPQRSAGDENQKVPPEAVYVITMTTPDGAGDGTVPESSARALDPAQNAKVKRDKKGKKIRRTFSIGDKAGVEADFVKKKAPRTEPKSPPDCDEAWFDRGHEPIYRSRSAQNITFAAIENLCRRRLEEHMRRGQP
jgi:hypothetical protein